MKNSTKTPNAKLTVVGGVNITGGLNVTGLNQPTMKRAYQSTK
jgi:cobalamin biosynthesis protein CbiD|tara:strand:+ start:2089 stop:2217 length:129 start_codon:yes stop_codon:yes gene_type:complete